MKRQAENFHVVVGMTRLNMTNFKRDYSLELPPHDLSWGDNTKKRIGCIAHTKGYYGLKMAY